ncbi:MAG TPA: hypothetical protein PKL65_14810 [Bacteroidales bacterium]|nr:hypothetical protein [Bacteroidales bacterium]
MKFFARGIFVADPRISRHIKHLPEIEHNWREEKSILLEIISIFVLLRLTGILFTDFSDEDQGVIRM